MEDNLNKWGANQAKLVSIVIAEPTDGVKMTVTEISEAIKWHELQRHMGYYELKNLAENM